MIINHNLSAMNAQRQLNISGIQRTKSSEKLSSGYRINRSADDAAGLTISEKMRSQIRGLDQGSRNVQDGISLLQVADGALNEVHDMLHRMNELSIQAANDTNNIEDREAIQQEIDQLSVEIDRISEDTEFNTVKLFKSDLTRAHASQPTRVTKSTVVTQISPLHYGVASVTATGLLNGVTDNPILLKADATGLHVNSELYEWDQIYSTTGDPLSSLGQHQSYRLGYKGSTITINTADCTDIQSIINSLDGVKINYTENTRTVTSPIISISANPFTYSGRFKNIDSNGNLTISFKGTEDYITITDGKSNSFASWSSVKYTEGTDTVEAEINNGVRVKFILNKTENYKEDFKAMLMSNSSPSIVYHGSLKYGPNDNYSITVNGQTYTTKVSGLWEALQEAGYTNPATITHGSATGTLGHGTGVHDVGSLLYINGKRLEFLLDGYGAVKLDIGASAGELYRYRFYYQKKDGTTSNAYVEIPIYYRYDMDVFETRQDLYSHKIAIFYESEYSPSSYDKGGDSGVVTTGVYSIEGLRTGQGTPEPIEIISDNAPIVYNQSSKGLWIQCSSGIYDGMFIDLDSMNSKILGVNKLNVLSHHNAEKSMEAVANALEVISEIRSHIGAQQNRLEHTYANVTNMAENTQAAESRIRDTDVAKEMVKQSILNILGQMGTTMLQQSNQTPQAVLQLL